MRRATPPRKCPGPFTIRKICVCCHEAGRLEEGIGRMNADFDDARRGLERLGFYTQAEAEGVEIERLGGLTNRVYMVRGAGGRQVLRIPGKGTEAYINRRVEAVAARAAARAGVSTEVIAFSDDGLMLTVTIENAATMTPESLNANPAAVARAGVWLRKAHARGENVGRASCRE